jgi:predicted ArsR family transcriptional regulator
MIYAFFTYVVVKNVLMRIIAFETGPLCLRLKMTSKQIAHTQTFAFNQSPTMSHQLSQNDHTMIGLLRKSPLVTVCELTETMGVTATAVRQRLNRLMTLELVERTHSVEGRGRPSHQYRLSDKGRRTGANNLGDLAVVLWEEVQKIADSETRHRVISGAVERLAEKYKSETSGETTEDRMRSIVGLFAKQKIPVSYETSNGLPVIKVDGCPYPTLAQDNREICDMEKELLSRLIGQPVDRCQCRQDGDSCCTYEVSSTAIGETVIGETAS